MGVAARGGGGGAAALGGAGAVLECRHTADLGGTLQVGVNTGWTDGGFARYGAAHVTIPGANPWANGSGGVTPNRGYVHLNGANFKRARNTAVGNTPIDWYSGVCPFPVTTRPAVDLDETIQVWEVGATMMLDGVPAVAITRDCGLVFILSGNTAYANCLRAGVAAGNDYAGFGVVFNGTNGELLWIDKKSGAFGGAPLTEQVSLGVYGAFRPIPVRVRIHSATKTAEAKVEVFVDGVLVLTRLWGAGTVLPVPADTAGVQLTNGYYRPMFRAAQESAANSALCWRQEYVRAAKSTALLR